ncbi:MAG: DNA replication and repair protein RecF, partial [Erysipelotrichaceae bacterium]
DDIEFYIGDNEMKSFASQGQQRGAILSFKLAEIELYKKYKKEKPILLLDDIFSELDHEKKDNILKYINNQIQTIITTTELDSLSENIIKNAKLIEIRNGQVINQKEVE